MKELYQGTAPPWLQACTSQAVCNTLSPAEGDLSNVNIFVTRDSYDGHTGLGGVCHRIVNLDI